MSRALEIILTTFIIHTVLFTWHLLRLQADINHAVAIYSIALILMVGLPLLAVAGWYRSKMTIFVALIYNILFLLTLLLAII